VVSFFSGHGVYTFFGALASNGISLGLHVQVLHSPLAALLHGTSAAAVDVIQTVAWYKEWHYGTFLQRAPPIIGRVAITLGISPHSSYGRSVE